MWVFAVADTPGALVLAKTGGQWNLLPVAD